VQAVPLFQTAGELSGACPAASSSESGKKRSRRSRRSKHNGSSSGESEVQELTTMMVKNIPNNLTRAALLELFDAEGFQGLYDFCYLPIDFDSDVNLGYCFVNMADGDAGQEFWKAFDGFCKWGGDRASTKICRLEWSQVQGLDAHIQRYRNSPLLHTSMPDERRPILLNEGVRVEFPPPTCSVKAPRRKGRPCNR
jgi:RNA recognition motif-containing protein